MNVELKDKSTFRQKFKKRCFDFSLAILAISEILRNDRKNWILLDQLVRSATSIGANVVEGGNSTSRREFINYFQIALKSASETLYWLALLREINVSKREEITILIQECTELKKLLITVIMNTKNNSKL